MAFCSELRDQFIEMAARHREQAARRPAFHKTPIRHDKDFVTIRHVFQAMMEEKALADHQANRTHNAPVGDFDDGAVAETRGQRELHAPVGGRIHMSSRFIKDEHPRVAEQSTRKAHELTLARGDAGARDIKLMVQSSRK